MQQWGSKRQQSNRTPWLKVLEKNPKGVGLEKGWKRKRNRNAKYLEDCRWKWRESDGCDDLRD